MIDDALKIADALDKTPWPVFIVLILIAWYTHHKTQRKEIDRLTNKLDASEKARIAEIRGLMGERIAEQQAHTSQILEATNSVGEAVRFIGSVGR